MWAPCTAFIPTPPTPTTTTTSPWATSARYTAEPHPVVTPHDTRATTGRGNSGSTFTRDASWTTPYSEKVPSLDITLSGLPS